MDVVLITLSGQGDTDRFVIPKSVYDWMLSIRPGTFEVPPEVIVALEPFRTDCEESWEDFKHGDDGTHQATFGSGTNDVAMLLGIAAKRYDSFRELMADCGDNGWQIVDEYEGYLY
jgi:hypothetical protein